MFRRGKSGPVTPSPEDILVRVSQLVLQVAYVDEWQRFMAEHSQEFEGDGDAKAGEYSLAATDVYGQFVALVERHLDDALEGLGYTAAQFMKMCVDLDKDEDRDGAAHVFLQLVLGATDFEVFGGIMRDPGKRAYYFQILSMWRKANMRSDPK